MSSKGAPAAGIAVAGAAGVTLVYGAITGRSPLSIFRAILHGASPGSVGKTRGIAGSTASTSAANLASTTAGKGQYDTASLRQLWQQAGGSAASSINAACHAMQESSGDPNATSGNPDGGTNVGLWQLDTRGVGSGYSVAQLQNPLTNARITVHATRDGTDWSQWSTPGC